MAAARSRREQLDERLDQAHRPYHEAIEEQLALLLDRFGCALLLDCHSMPPPPAGRCRRSCSAIAAAAPPTRWVSAEAHGDRCAAAGFDAGLNDPFAGGHVIERHARPARGVHALQIEIDRRCYLDATLEARRAPDSTASPR